MVKTTINLDTEVYRELVNEAVKRYGSTKTLSKLINEKLKSGRKGNVDIIRKSAGIWKLKESGYEYTRRIRHGSEKRLKRFYG
jgi:predicted CopG family antitoxin